MKIPLFDNDLTLTRLKPGGVNAHDGAFDHAFKTVYGIDAHKSEIKTDGMIDPQIIATVLVNHGLSPEQIEVKMEEAMQDMVKFFKENCHQGEFEPLVGVKELLVVLKEQGIPVGVLTGNIEGIAEIKLTQAGIWDFIQFGAYGNLAPNRKRVELIEVAAQRAKQAGIELAGNQLCIVGDAQLDVRTAKLGDIKSVAVATGVFSIEDLTTEGPELVVKSFADPADRDRFIKFLKTS
jgi:phosphoglycolate phosphatase